MSGPDLYDAFPELYDEQYASYRDDVPFYRRVVEDAGGGPVLEIGAGTARLSSALARAGHEVVGLEPSPAMRARAEARLRAEGLEGRARVVAGDARGFDLGRRFPVVIAPFHMLMHLATVRDQDAALAAMARHLEPGGLFACDLFRPKLGPLGVLRREPEWRGVGGEGAELWLVQEHDPVRQVVRSRYLLDRTDAEGVVRRRTAVLTQRYWHRFELERALVQAGFEGVRIFGDFDRSPPEALGDDAPRWVALARAPKGGQEGVGRASGAVRRSP